MEIILYQLQIFFILILFVLLLYRYINKYKEAEKLKDKMLLNEKNNSRNLENINAIVKSIHSGFNSTDLLNSILNQIRIIKGVERAIAFIYDEKEDLFNIKITSDRRGEERTDDINNFLNKKISKQDLFNFCEKNAERISENIFLYRKAKEKQKINKISFIDLPLSMIVARIVKGNKILGYFVFKSLTKENAFNDSDIQLLKGLETHITSAFIKVQLLENLTKKTEELKLANKKAISANKAKSSFLANMSHELRTPLNAIIGYSEILMEDAEDEDNNHYISDLKKIKTAGINLLGLINEILDLSKVEAGKMELYLEEFDLFEVIKDVIDIIIPIAKKNNNKVEFINSKSKLLLKADKTKLRQSLLNLLSNACKFTKDGIIKIEIDPITKNNKDCIQFSVSDNGIGMSDEQCKKVFEPFTQADNSTTREYGGTGLGLTITRVFCQMMGGDIAVESKVNEGTKFKFYIPKKVKDLKNQAKVDPSIKLEPKNSKNSKVRILIIDDDSTVHDLIHRHYKNNNFQIISAFSGKEGIDLAQKYVPDIITLDVLMPEMDGWSVLSKIKENKELSEIPVIMMSMINNENLGYSLGATDYMTKPIDWTKLNTIIEKYSIDLKSTILIVEDDNSTRNLTKKILEKENINVETAVNGRYAIEVLKKIEPGLILLDLMMPEMNGFEFIEIIKKNSDWIKIPIVVVTSKDLTSEEKNKLKGNVETILQKGQFMKDDLIKMVTKVIKQNNIEIKHD